MKWRRVLLLMVSTFVLALLAWLVWPRGPLQWVRLRNGSHMQVVTVTYGTRHAASVGSFRERATRLLPGRIFPSWPRPLALHTNTPRDTLVVWLCASNWPADFGTYGSGFVAGTNGVELETGRVLARAGGQGRELLALAVDAFPRHEQTFTLRLRNVYQLIGNTMQPVPLAETVLSNPARIQSKPWRASQAPQRVRTEEFECELHRCEVNLHQPIGTPLFLDWRFSEAGVPVDQWKVDRVELEDASGNLLRESWADGPASSKRGPSAGFLRRSLWPDAGAWKVRAFVQRRDHFPSNEVWEVRGIPLPGQPEFGTHLWRTNLNGEWLEAGSAAALAHSRILPRTLGFPRGPGEWAVALFGSLDVQDRAQLLALVDDQGRPGTSRGTLTVDQLQGWLREWEPDAKSYTMRLGLSHWRVVEVLVEPTVLSASVVPGLE